MRLGGKCGLSYIPEYTSCLWPQRNVGSKPKKTERSQSSAGLDRNSRFMRLSHEQSRTLVKPTFRLPSKSLEEMVQEEKYK